MVFEVIKTLTQFQSLALTAPLVALCIVVLWEVRGPAKEVCLGKNRTKDQKRMGWIFTGIIIGFTGKIIESLWWAIPWTADYLEIPDWKELHNVGVFFNLIFRQLFFTISAYCYLRAFLAPSKQDEGLRSVHWIFGMSLVMGQLYLIALLVIKNPLQ